MNRKHNIQPDAKFNPALRDQIGTLRGGMLDAAHSAPVPKRFITTPDDDAPRMHITDTVTGRTTTVALCDYRGVRKVLKDLFD